MQCTQCGETNPDRAKFCASWGTALTSKAKVKKQKAKGKSNSPKTQSSDTELRTADPGRWTPPHLAERIRSEQAALEARGATDGERKSITALFADIKGSTDLIADLNPDRFYDCCPAIFTV
jgi:hypothetical protein